MTINDAIDPRTTLPEPNTYVLGYFPSRPWKESTNTNKHKLVVVQFIPGISKEQRKQLPDSNPRKYIYRDEDQYGNNKVPYCWESFTSGTFFGQECLIYWELPNI